MIRGWSWLRSGREHWSWQVVEQTRRRRRRTRRRTRRAGNWHKRGKTQQQSWPTRPPQATAKNTTAELAHTAAPNISKKHNSRAGRHGRPTLAKKNNSRAGRHGRPKQQQKTQQQSWPTRPPQTSAKNTTAELADTAAPNNSKLLYFVRSPPWDVRTYIYLDLSLISGILPDIYSDIYSGILSGILPDIYSAICPVMSMLQWWIPPNPNCFRPHGPASTGFISRPANCSSTSTLTVAGSFFWALHRF